MKKLVAITIAVTMLLSLAGTVSAAKPGTDFNGPHFNLNLVGKTKLMPGDYDNPDRHTMFVPANTEGLTFTNPSDPASPVFEGVKITITQPLDGVDFAVIDGNATDGFGSFQLAPGKYSVYIAMKAKVPKSAGTANITGWVEAYDAAGELWYYINVGSVGVSKSNKSWTDGTGLFFVNTDEDTFDFLTGSEQGYIPGLGMWVFDYMAGLDTWTGINPSTGLPYDLSNLAYFWQLVNNGGKLIQVRFYRM